MVNYNVTEDTPTPYSEEDATCPSCSKIFKIRYNSISKALIGIGNAGTYEEITASCKKYTHSCGAVILISNC